MEIHKATFVKSSENLSQLPPVNLPEYAFVGRSNVGKSSWINTLTGRKNLARTSSSPGKTRLINHFLIDDAWYIADLPGYGYAKVSKKERQAFEKMIATYIDGRPNLVSLFVLVDSRIPPQSLDLEFIGFLGAIAIPFTILLTKTDKPKQGEVARNLNAFKSALLRDWEELPPIIQTSSVSGRGRSRVLGLIAEWNTRFVQPQQ